MNEINRINSLMKEADVYQKQGLLEQSKDKYQAILDTLKTAEDLPERDTLIQTVKEKIQMVEKTMDEVDGAPDAVHLSEEVQGLIKNLFSFAKNKESAAVEAAVALATFGQYKKALEEFHRLLNEGVMPLTVAKNLLRCHLSLGQPEAAAAQFQYWISKNVFSTVELSKLRDFLQHILEREGIHADLPVIDTSSVDEEAKPEIQENVFEDDAFGIISVRTIFNNESQIGRMKDFDVIFQFGNTITFEVNANDKDLLDYFKPGLKLPRVQCYADFFLFNAKGIISEKREVTSGPKQGRYSFVLTLENPLPLI